MNIIYAGCIGRCPIGGQAWADMQYLLGLTELGHEVTYLEECGEGSWVYNWETEEVTTELDYPASYVRDCMVPRGFSHRWIYRAGENSRGMTLEEFLAICAQADLFIVRGSLIDLWRPEYDLPKRRIFIDTDPAFTQIRIVNGELGAIGTVAHCERLFTYGTRIGESDCPIPTGGHEWIKTVMPVFLPQWNVMDDRQASHFTTIMQWRSYATVSHAGVTYGNKDLEFPKFISLPRHTAQRFRVALIGAPSETLSAHGWEVVPGWIATRTAPLYQLFIQNSYAEFGIAKHAYVAARSGWLSDRSICYLASGRPALVQDTFFSDWLPTGEGILKFSDMNEAIQGIDAINNDYERHCRSARLLAEEYFASDRVLGALIQEAMA